MNEDYVGEMQKLTEGVVSLNSDFKMEAKLTRSEVVNLSFKACESKK